MKTAIEANGLVIFLQELRLQGADGDQQQRGVENVKDEKLAVVEDKAAAWVQIVVTGSCSTCLLIE